MDMMSVQRIEWHQLRCVLSKIDASSKNMSSQEDVGKPSKCQWRDAVDRGPILTSGINVLLILLE